MCANAIDRITPFDTTLELKIVSQSGALRVDKILSEGVTNDGVSGSRLDRPSIVDLGNSQFLVAYTPTNINVTSSNGGMAQIFDYSGNFVTGFSLVSDSGLRLLILIGKFWFVSPRLKFLFVKEPSSSFS